jgi:hypothetical protein
VCLGASHGAQDLWALSPFGNSYYVIDGVSGTQVGALIGSPCLGVCTHCDPIMCAGGLSVAGDGPAPAPADVARLGQQQQRRQAAVRCHGHAPRPAEDVLRHLQLVRPAAGHRPGATVALQHDVSVIISSPPHTRSSYRAPPRPTPPQRLFSYETRICFWPLRGCRGHAGTGPPECAPTARRKT